STYTKFIKTKHCVYQREGILIKSCFKDPNLRAEKSGEYLFPYSDQEPYAINNPRVLVYAATPGLGKSGTGNKKTGTATSEGVKKIFQKAPPTASKNNLKAPPTASSNQSSVLEILKKRHGELIYPTTSTEYHQLSVLDKLKKRHGTATLGVPTEEEEEDRKPAAVATKREVKVNQEFETPYIQRETPVTSGKERETDFLRMLELDIDFEQKVFRDLLGLDTPPSTPPPDHPTEEAKVEEIDLSKPIPRKRRVSEGTTPRKKLEF
ncbi:MAG TPA: hypothetical protein VLS94_11890, partial [Fusibacter sp.]|nr:hypothetical protein [Fusibacter sp.]